MSGQPKAGFSSGHAVDFVHVRELEASGLVDFVWNAGPYQAMRHGMSNDLYECDALAWSERQAALLRRVATGERINDVDWDHVVEEIEDVGLSELHTEQSYLQRIMVHLLKWHGWPEIGAEQHWRAEIVTFQSDAERRFAPSMRQRIDLAKIYQRAVQQIEFIRYGGNPAVTPPAACPVTLDQLLTASCAELETAFSSQSIG